MNKRYLIALLALILLSSVPAITFAGSWNGWIYQNPYPTSNTLLAVKFVTPKKGWVVGELGTILYTEDGGDNWEAQESGTEQELKSLSFVNEKQGWAVGNGGVIVHTEDGGKTWVSQGNVTKATLNSVFFINDKEGWSVGNNGTVLHTSDAGRKWERQNAGIRRSIASVFFINSQTGWILAGDEIYRTKESGKKWEKSQLPVKMERTGNLPGGGRFMNMMGERLPDDWWQGEIFFADNQNGWAVVGKWFIFHTEDGGKTWTDQLMSPMSYSIGHLFFKDSKSGCATGTSILCTEDGKTWTERLDIKPGGSKIINGFSISPEGVSFVGQSVGWIAGRDGLIMKTEDGGKTWKVIARRNECGYLPFFVNQKTGWLHFPIPTYTHICRTDDGGHTWTRQEVGIGEIRIFFVNDSTGWAVGLEEEDTKKSENETFEQGIMRRSKARKYIVIKQTTDGGQTWTTQFKELATRDEHGFVHSLTGVFLVDLQTGWAVGGNGLILHTVDGGGHWIRQQSGTKLNLGDVYFADHKRGIATGDHSFALGEDDNAKGIILYTGDGGKHWRSVWERPQVLLVGTFFVDKNHAWAAADTGGGTLILHSEDGGQTWTKTNLKNIPDGLPLFLDKDRGIIFLDKEKIFATRDGGKSWQKMRMPIRKYPWHFSDLFEKTQSGK